MRKIPKVNIYSSVSGYKLKIAVYRADMTPEEISVHIEEIYPAPPNLPSIPDSEKDVLQIIEPGVTANFEPQLYPGNRYKKR